MKLKIIIFLAILVLFVGGGYFLFFRKPDQKLPSFTAKEAEELTTDRARMIREKGEAGLRRKQYLPLVKVYEDLLTKYPDNKDLKKKLAESYENAGEAEKARKLREEMIERVE